MGGECLHSSFQWLDSERCLQCGTPQVDLKAVFPKNRMTEVEYLRGLNLKPEGGNEMPYGGLNVKPGEIISTPIEAPSDNWQHRSDQMKCRSCIWFVRKLNEGPLGRCRRHAPTMSGYPAVYEHDWCGDHKLDGTKL